MKNKIGKSFSVFLVLIVISILFLAYTNTDAATNSPVIGDLRCPLDISDKDNVRCETVEKNGVVVEVRMIYGNPNDIQIIKYVRKTEDLGTYEVEFEVKGDVEQRKVSEPAYVSVILDMSQTIKGQETEAIAAAKKLAKTLVPVDGGSNFYVSLWQFGTNAYQRQKLENKNFDKTDFLTYSGFFSGKNRHKSFVDKAFEGVYNELSSKEGKKYVVLLGDGYYWWPDHTNVGTAMTNADNLRKIGANFFVLRYKSSEDSESQEAINPGNSANCFKLSKKQCNINNMLRFMLGSSYTSSGKCSTHTWWNSKHTYSRKYTQCKDFTYPKNYYETPDKSKYEEIFEQIANQIIEESGGSKVMSELNDRIGSSFFLEERVRFKHFNVGQITKNGIKTDSFEITIDELANTGWHKTNENFEFKYTDADGNPKTITVIDNPEVYWVQPNLNIPSCTGSSEITGLTKNGSLSDESDTQYYAIRCSEGYLNDAKKMVSGYKVNLTLNRYNKNNLRYEDLKSGEKEFDTYGIGFSVNLDLSTNIKCTYSFDTDKFNEDYKSYQKDYERAIANSKNSNYDASERELFEKDAVGYQLKLENMSSIVDDYNKLSNSNLDNYKLSFEKQEATMTVTYNDNKTEKVNLENSGEISAPKSCYGISKKTLVNNKPVTSSETCTLSLSKKMTLPNSCLSMKTGDSVSCSDTKSQLGGGNMFYTKYNATSGYIDINILNAGYKGNLDFKLEGKNENSCSFTQTISKPIYRQISLSDPFIKDLTPERQIGKNYLNDRYSFVNIITSDLWETDSKNIPKYDYDYYYEMGKQNIENIRKDTKNKGADSYLGSKCEFTTDNKYICLFTRNQTDYGESDQKGWFNTAKFNR